MHLKQARVPQIGPTISSLDSRAQSIETTLTLLPLEPISIPMIHTMRDAFAVCS